MENTTEQETKKPPELRNPEGKGGFGDHPENINPGGRPKNQESITYWYKFFLNLSFDEFEKWEALNPERPMAAVIAYEGIKASKGKLDDRKEVADRTEGKPRQFIDVDANVRTTDLTNKELAKGIKEIVEEDGTDNPTTTGASDNGEPSGEVPVSNDTQEDGGNPEANTNQV